MRANGARYLGESLETTLLASAEDLAAGAAENR